MIELCTRAYAEACPKSPDLAGAAFETELTRVVQACERGKKLGLKILAGHGLTYRNVGAISAIPEIEELNIGHNIIARLAGRHGTGRSRNDKQNDELRITNYELKHTLA
jgi:pyridoxine 5'-phosphate synthase PdxJ